jgi:hypothetical protein
MAMTDDADPPQSVYVDKNPDDEARRYRAVRRLLEARDPGALEHALDLTQSAIEAYRAAPVELAPQLGALLDHPEAAVRRRAAELIAVSVDGARASAERLSLLLDDHDAVVADAAARGLARIGDERLLPRVISALEDPAGPQAWIPDALRGLSRHADLLLPTVRSALIRLATECVSEPGRMRPLRKMLLGMADWGAAARDVIEEVDAVFPAGCGKGGVATDIAQRGDVEPAHLATVFECTTGLRTRARMRRRLRQVHDEKGTAAIEAEVDQAIATMSGPYPYRVSVVIDLAVIAANGTMRPEHEALLEQALDDGAHSLHTAYALWLRHGARAAERACAVLTPTVADAYFGPTALGYLAEMGPDAAGALAAIDAVLARRRRLTVNDPDWRHELRTDEDLCAAARSARHAITTSGTLRC